MQGRQLIQICFPSFWAGKQFFPSEEGSSFFENGLVCIKVNRKLRELSSFEKTLVNLPSVSIPLQWNSVQKLCNYLPPIIYLKQLFSEANVNWFFISKPVISGPRSENTGSIIQSAPLISTYDMAKFAITPRNLCFILKKKKKKKKHMLRIFVRIVRWF